MIKITSQLLKKTRSYVKLRKVRKWILKTSIRPFEMKIAIAKWK